MKITRTYGWYRRDFSYDAKCEHCGQEDKNLSGYDDSNYYNNVVPTIKCSKCKETSLSKPIVTDTPNSVYVPKHNEHAVM
jgi:hypothetical protein